MVCCFRDVEGAAAIQQALSGENFLEKERRLSEMILQLQMVREQLLTQQQQAQEQNKVSRFRERYSLMVFLDRLS